MNDTDTQLFALRPKYSDKPCRVETPRNAQGETILTRQGIAQFLDQDVKLSEIKILNTGRLCDFLLTFPSCLVVSNRVHQQFSSLFANEFRAYPVDVQGGAKAKYKYWFIVPERRHCIVDFGKAEIAYFDNIKSPAFARRVLKWAIDYSRVPDSLLFSDELGGSIARLSTKVMLEAFGATGIEFVPLENLQEPLMGSSI